MTMIRVFPRRTSMTPTDPLAFVGEPPLFGRPVDHDTPIAVSCTFTWDIPEAKLLQRSWSRFYSDVQIGGPAFGDPGGKFIAGRFLKKGISINSRGCKRRCRSCLVPKREGKIREIGITEGHIVQDNNIMAFDPKYLTELFQMLRLQKRGIKFTGGLDARLFQPEHVALLRSIRLAEAWFACDSKGALRSIRRISKLLPEPEFGLNKKRCYALVGFDGDTIDQAEMRCREIWNFGFLPFAQFYRGPNETNRITPERWSSFVRTWSRPAATKAHMKSASEDTTATWM